MAKILLVEDDNNLREIYGARLTAEGYDIVSAPDGEEALAIAVKEKPDLIITDVMMPKISGFDMLDILRNAPETKDTKVIMMTALSQAEDKERADKLGADLYLVKSQVTLEDVAASVKMTLSGGGNSKDEAPKSDVAAPTPDPSPTPEPPKPEPEPSPAPPPAPAPAPEPAPAPNPAPPAVSPAVDTENKDTATPQTASAPAAPSAQTPPPPPVQDDAATNPIPASPQASAPASTPEPPSTPAPTPPAPAAPAPTEPPAAPPAPEPPKPAAKKIEVVLPDAKDEPAKNTDTAAAKPAEEKPAPDLSKPAEEPPASPDVTADPTLSIGPNLAEALAEEEKNTQEQPSEEDDSLKIEGLTPDPSAPPQEPTPPPAEPSSTEPSTVVKPQTNAALDGSGAPGQAQDSAPKLGGMTGKKVIEPINDPTKSPDLNELLAKEESKDQTTPSPGPVANQGGNPPEHPDDFSKISL